MVDALASGAPLTSNVVDSVSERTGGVPLFVEEVTRLILERGEQSGMDAIPPTLQQSLAARLDRLGAAREIAEIGAVLGREFSYTLLRDVSGLPDVSLQASLARLTEADILVVAGARPAASYRFKHALIQDAAYENSDHERPAGLAPAGCRSAPRFGRRSGAGRARGDRISLHAGWPGGSRDRMVGQGRRRGVASFGFPGSNRAPRQRDRTGRRMGIELMRRPCSRLRAGGSSCSPTMHRRCCGPRVSPPRKRRPPSLALLSLRLRAETPGSGSASTTADGSEATRAANCAPPARRPRLSCLKQRQKTGPWRPARLDEFSA